MKSMLIAGLLVVTVSSAAVMAPPQHPKKAMMMTKGMLCNLCKDFVGLLQDYITNNEADIRQKAEQACDQVTSGIDFLDGICRQWVDNALDNIIDFVHQHESSEQICTQLEAC